MKQLFCLLFVFFLCVEVSCYVRTTAADRVRPHAHGHATHTIPTNDQHAKISQQNINDNANQLKLQQSRSSKSSPYYDPVMGYHEEPFGKPTPLYEATAAIEAWHSSGSYDLEVNNSISNALVFAQSMPFDNTTVWIFDIDETSLSGYSEMQSIGFGYVAKLSKDWILSASAPAIPQTMQLYKTIISLGMKVIFLTGRTWDEADATAKNLQSVGYTVFEQLITRSPAEVNMTATDFKSNHRTILVEQQGYSIQGCIGDQYSDLHGPYTGFKVKLPNYIYWLP